MEGFTQRTLERTEKAVIEAFKGEGSGHDHYHILRVRDNALRIFGEEKEGDPFLVEMAALLHDVGDPKFFNGDAEAGEVRLIEWMEALELPASFQEDLKEIVRHVSFKGGKEPDRAPGPESMIVQDADRLDAMGAIGIARSFCFGGSKGRPIHVPDEEPVLHVEKEVSRAPLSPTIDHFYEKLLLLKGQMKTRTGERIAEDRHRYMEGFLEQFFKEWKGEA